MNTSFPNNDGNYPPARRRPAPGFTLTEILIAIALIVIIATVAVTNLVGVYERGEEQVAQLFVKQDIDPALMSYRMDVGTFPTTAQGLRALVEKPDGVLNWHGPYTKPGAKLQDPWGSDYNYAYPAAHNPSGYDCWSNGPDKLGGTADDIANWQ